MRGRWVLLHLKYRRHRIPAAAVPQAGGAAAPHFARDGGHGGGI